jgi:hypothetical protein
MSKPIVSRETVLSYVYNFSLLVIESLVLEDLIAKKKMAMNFSVCFHECGGGMRIFSAEMFLRMR